jgi:NAD(P)-dependent dehydrogenase (short-subunit alcohol dehydrogenase family)
MVLKNKRVLILGGTSGIGFAVAQAAAAESAQVVVVSSQPAKVDAATALLRHGCAGFVADLSSERAIAALFEKVGPFDHLVFTAGDTVWQRPLADIAMDDAKRFFDVRFWGAFAASKHGAPLIRPGGSVVLTSSTVPRRPSVGFSIGASVSSAIEAFARALAVELAPVRVNVVAPGIVRTPIWDRLPEDQREAFFATRGAALPVGKVGDPAEIAETYLYLMRSSFTTGQTIVVDGGMLLV